MNPGIRRTAIATTLSLLACSGYTVGAGDTYYRWLDASGTPVNSDRPPPVGIQYEVITTNTNTAVSPGAEQDPATGSASSRTAPQPQGIPVSSTAVEKNPEACAAAKRNLETLNTHARIRKPDDEGNFRFLNEEEKATERAQAEAILSQNCD